MIKSGRQILRVVKWTKQRHLGGDLYVFKLNSPSGEHLDIVLLVPFTKHPHSLIKDLQKLSAPPKPWMYFTLTEVNKLLSVQRIEELKEDIRELLKANIN